MQYVENVNSILESIPQVTFSADADGKFTFFNNFFLDYSGMSLPDALQGGLKPLLHINQQDKFDAAWKHSIETGENFKMEFQMKRDSDSKYFWHTCSAIAIRDTAGVITSWVGAATDIQEQKTKEEAKDEFISIASHELKTPLTTAKAYIQLLEQSMEDRKDEDLIYAQKASNSITKLNDLIGELLDVSKIQHGKLGLKVTTFNFNDMLAEAIEGVQFTSYNHTIIKTGKLHKDIKGDRERLQQVVINLLTNAVKYSPKSKKTVVNVHEENGVIKVAIKDNGIGIRKENLGKIFERYYREDARSMNFQGLGIGLSISKAIIDRHNGKIWAESEPGKGSIFYFTIPI